MCIENEMQKVGSIRMVAQLQLSCHQSPYSHHVNDVQKAFNVIKWNEALVRNLSINSDLKIKAIHHVSI